VTTKLADHHKIPGFPEKALKSQLESLNLEYVDLYLIHSPWSLIPTDNPWDQRGKKTDENGKLLMADVPITDTWKEIEKLVDSGKVKSLGVSNFSESQIERRRFLDGLGLLYTIFSWVY